MRRQVVAVLLAVTVLGCAGPVSSGTRGPTVQPATAPASSASQPSGPSSPSSASTGLPTVTCVGGVPPAICEQAEPVVLAAVGSSGWTPIQIWFDSGEFCPRQDCLFDPSQNFPAAPPPNGGEWVANAEVAFAQTDEHAGLQIASIAGRLVAVLIGYRTPLVTWCSGLCPTSSSTDGDYRLELTVPHQAWKVGDAISGQADLELTGSLPKTVWGAGELIVFSYSEVGGTRQYGPMSLLDCGPFPLDPATPLGVALIKQGTVTASGADADFQRSFMADPQIHLPVGTWDITAIADFNEGADCSGVRHTIKTTLRVSVTG